MSVTRTGKALTSLKQRVNAFELNLELGNITEEKYIEALKCKDEIKILIEAYEKQIELNKKQNIKIKNQRGILKILQQKQGDKVGKTNI